MFLITRPNYDLPTTYLYAFSQEVVDYAHTKLVKVADLKGKKANKKTLFSYLNKRDISFVFINGHGSQRAVYGQDGELLVDGYKKCFENLILYSRSCSSAKLLAGDMVKKGLGVFVGYKKDYIVLMSRWKENKPRLDKMAGLFLKPSNLLAMSILKGNTVNEANKKSKKMLKKNIRNVITSKMKNKASVLAYLFHDLKSQVVIGNGDLVMKS
ncbi:hypothetical protein DRH14_03115 [Candidatus Shapirobacteria bacterium]|nr:MAG: hypothetical protein DRH14_03115 [Candidatus Shapirobacteria bacterium]